jgi:hypothetical protein
LVVIAVGAWVLALVDTVSRHPDATASGGCDLLTQSTCFTTFDLHGRNGQLPTPAEFIASMGVNDGLAYEWHLNTPPPDGR